MTTQMGVIRMLVLPMVPMNTEVVMMWGWDGDGWMHGDDDDDDDADDYDDDDDDDDADDDADCFCSGYVLLLWSSPCAFPSKCFLLHILKGAGKAKRSEQPSVRSKERSLSFPLFGCVLDSRVFRGARASDATARGRRLGARGRADHGAAGAVGRHFERHPRHQCFAQDSFDDFL